MDLTWSTLTKHYDAFDVMTNNANRELYLEQIVELSIKYVSDIDELHEKYIENIYIVINFIKKNAPNDFPQILRLGIDYILKFNTSRDMTVVDVQELLRPHICAGLMSLYTMYPVHRGPRCKYHGSTSVVSKKDLTLICKCCAKEIY